MTKKTATTGNIWAHHTYPGDAERKRIQAEIDAIVARIDTSLFDKTKAPAEMSTIDLDNPNKIVNDFSTENLHNYGAAYKYVKGKQVPLTDVEKTRRSRLKDKRTCFLEVGFGMLRYAVLDLFGRPLKAVADVATKEVAIPFTEQDETPAPEPQPKQLTVDTTVKPSIAPTLTVEEEVASEFEFDQQYHTDDYTSEDRMNMVNMKRVAYFGVAVWVGLTLALSVMNTAGLLTV